MNTVRLGLRILALIIGLVGAAVMLIVNILYSTAHRLGTFTHSDVTAANTHGWIGFLLVIVGAIGAVAAPINGDVAAILLVIAGIGFFFIVHAWALLFASPLILLAALLAFLDRRRSSTSA